MKRKIRSDEMMLLGHVKECSLLDSRKKYSVSKYQYSVLITDDEEEDMLGASLFWIVTQRRPVVLYVCFGTIYRCHLQESSSWNA